MNLPRLAADPDWKKFLGLGEQLLKQPDAAAQCRLIVDTLETLFGCNAQVWLNEPHYPLPGQPEVATLPDATAPTLVQQVVHTLKPACQTDLKTATCDPQLSPRAVAFPILSQSTLLGVIYAHRHQGSPFRAEEWNFFEALAAHAGVALQSTRQTTLKNWRYEQLALVSSVSAQVANLTDLNLLCRQVTRLILDTFHFSYVAIFTLDADSSALFFRGSATQEDNAEPPLSYTVHLGEGMIGTAAQVGEPQISGNVSDHPHYRHLAGLEKTRSEAAIPLKTEGRTVGVLDVQSDRYDAFHDNDLLVLHALADAITLAVEGARLYTAMQQRAERNSAVFEVSHILTSILNLDQLLEEVVQVIQKRFGYPYVHIFSVHSGRRKVFYLTGSGARSQEMRRLDMAYDLDDSAGIIPHVARQGETYLANDVGTDPLYRPSELPPDDTCAELAIPLVFGAEVLGVLDLQSSHSQTFSADDVSLLEAVAGSIAIAYHNATLYRSEQWRRQVGDSFRDVAGLLSGNVALERLLETIMVEMERILPCDAAAVWLLDDDGGATNVEPSLRLAAVHGVSAEDITHARTESVLVRNWLNAALDQTLPLIRRPQDPYGPLGAALGFPADYSSIAATLRTGDQPLGILTLAHRTANRYGTEARTIIATFASYAAVAIQNARLYSEAQTQAWLSTILLQVAEASQSVNSIDELLSSMVRLTRLLVGIKKCAMFLWDEGRSAFILTAWYGLERKPERTFFHEDEVPAFARLRATRNTLVIEDAAAELNLPTAALSGTQGTLVMLPLQARDALLGAFLVAHQPTNPITPHTTLDEQTHSILQGIAHQTAVTLENMRLLDARQEEAYVTAVLLQVAQAVVSQNELKDILDTIVHLMPILVGIDACVVCLWSPDQQIFYTAQVYAGAHDLEQNLNAGSYPAGSFRLLEQIRQTDAPQYCKICGHPPAPAGWLGLPPLPIEWMKSDTLEEDEEWLLGFPLSVKGELLGVMLTKETAGTANFQDRRLEIITGITQQVALAIQNERLKQEMVVREGLEREVELAREIQTTFLPSHLPQVPGWQIAARWQTARQVGGDFYDIFPLGRDRLGLAVADVSDKGLPAALYMTVARTLIRAFSNGARSASAVLERVNKPLVADTPQSMFVTAVYAMLWPESGQLLYANAGHNRPLLLRAGSRAIEQLPKGGMAMGVLRHSPLEEYTLHLEPGDCLVLFTDGVTECMSPENETYGDARLLETLQGCLDLEVEDVLNAIVDSLAQFRASAPTSDDMTLLAIRRL